MPTKTLTVVSAYKLNQNELESIMKSLDVVKNNQINVENVVDQSILAGLIVKYNGYYLDLSLKSKLKDITNNLS